MAKIKGIVLVALFFFVLPAFCGNTIKKIGVIGNKLVSPDIILLALDVKVGEELTEDIVQKNMKLIYELGYFSDVGAKIEDIDDGKYLIFKVKENKVVKTINISGNKVISLHEIQEIMKTKIGSIFNIPVFNKDIKNINKLYKSRGYVLSSVRNVKVDDHGSSIKIEITEGRLEDIKIEGNDSTKDWVILREFSIKPGDIYNSNKIRRSLQKVFNLGYFETIKPAHLKGKNPDDVVLVLNVKEQKTGTASFGGGYSSNNGLVGFIQVSKKNFMGRGQTIKVKGEFGGVTNYELGFVEPWLRHKPISLGFNIYNTKTTQDQYDENGNYLREYDERRKGGDISIGKKLAYFTSGSISFSDQNIDVTPEDYSTGLEDDHIQTLGLSISRDSRDNVFQPTFGAYDSLSISKTGGFLKGNNNYTKYYSVFRRYYEIKPKNIFAFRLIYGMIDLAGGDVPEYEEFGLGGSSNLRGYRNRELIGREIAVTNFEYRHIFTKKFTGILFFDAGDVTKSLGTRFNFNKQGVGVGVSVKSPIGPIRLDYGKGNNGRGGRTYFTMAESF